MNILVKLLPPFNKPGKSGEFSVKLSAVIKSPEELARFITETLGEELACPVFDKYGNLNAEFLLNGKPFLVGGCIDAGSHILVIPHICGG